MEERNEEKVEGGSTDSNTGSSSTGNSTLPPFTRDMYKEAVAPLCLMDNDVAIAAFKKDKEHKCLKKIVCKVLGLKDVTIRSVNTEETLVEPCFHGVRLDIYMDGNAGICDIEMQNIRSEDLKDRAFFYLSKLTTHAIGKGGAYSSSPDKYVIFVMRGQLVEGDTGPVNIYEMRNKKTGKPLGVGAYIVCFDVTQATEGELETIAHDLTAVNVEDIRDKDFREVFLPIKCPWEGGSMEEAVQYDPRIMRVIKKYWGGYAEEYAKDYAKDLTQKLAEAQAQIEFLKAQAVEQGRNQEAANAARADERAKIELEHGSTTKEAVKLVYAAMRMLAKHYPLEEIAEIQGLSIDDVRLIQEGAQKISEGS